MRSTSALYRFACEEEGCTSHTDLVKFFHGVDVALQAAAPPADSAALSDVDDSVGDLVARTPPLPALKDPLLIAFRPDLRYPTHINLSASYLGDGGAAAFFRVLPILRWLRVVEARGVGAGARTMSALRGGLTAYLVDGCEDAPTMEAVEQNPCSLTSHPLAGRLPALESVDLRDNDAIFSSAVEELLVVLQRRRTTLLRWCIQHGERDPEAALLPALSVYVSPTSLLPTTAAALQRWNDASAAVWLQRESAAAAVRWREQLRIFTSFAEGAPVGAGRSAPTQPTGEQVVFRLPLSAPDEREGRLQSHADALRRSINAHMPQFLRAACMLAPCTTGAKDASVYAAAEGAYAALQACIDFGADALDILYTSNAALWRAARMTPQQQAKGGAPSPPSSVIPRVTLLEAQSSISTLLRVLAAAPSLEEELLSSAAAGGVVVARHLHRLREMEHQLRAAVAHHAPMAPSDFAEAVQLYTRVVAAVVTQRFSEHHLPSFAAYEPHVTDVAEYVLQHLLIGENDAATLSAMVSRLQVSVELRLALPRQERGKLAAVADADGERTRVLPPVMAACHYHLQRHPAKEEAWKQAYVGTSAVVAAAARRTCCVDTELPAAMHAFHRCSCENNEEQGETRAATPTTASRDVLRGCSAPCTTCAYRSLCSVQDVLSRPPAEVEEEEEWCLRWERQACVREALPRSLRMCLLDLVVRQRSRQQGGCAYVPPLPSTATEAPEAGRWSMAAWLACVHEQETYWVAVLRAFGQWYRLRVFESHGNPKALALLQSTW